MGIFLSVLSGFFLLIIGVTCSIGSDDRKQIFAYNFYTPFFTLILALIFITDWQSLLSGAVIYPGKTSLVLIIGSLCGMGYVFTLMFAMNAGPHSLSLCLGESCLLIPYLVSIIFFNDRLTFAGLAGIIFIVASIIVTGITKEKNINKNDLSPKWFLFIIIAFSLGGIELLLNTIPNRWPGWSDTANIRPALIQVGRLVMFIPLIVKKIKATRKTLIISFISAVFSLLVTFIQFKAMDILVKDNMLAILYPIALGTYILLFTSYGYFYKKERISKSAYISMATILAGIVLISL